MVGVTVLEMFEMIYMVVAVLPRPGQPDMSAVRGKLHRQRLLISFMRQPSINYVIFFFSCFLPTK